MHTLLVILIYDVLLNLLGFAISAPLQTERIYDIFGAATFIGMTVIMMIRDLSWPQVVAGACVLTWALRLGILLGIRGFKVGDRRFDDFKKNPLKFLQLWVGQMAWGYITALPVYFYLNNEAQFSAWNVVGFLVYSGGFSLEVAADRQKSKFKYANPSEPFMGGLFKFCRHPNYLGEIVLWFGMYLYSLGGFHEWWEYFSVINTGFVYALLKFGSGARLSEKEQNRKYGTRPDWKEYMESTNCLFPKISSFRRK